MEREEGIALVELGDRHGDLLELADRKVRFQTFLI
jgi:hypothetical protein